MPSVTFSADCRMSATVEIAPGPVSDVAVTVLADGRLAVELSGPDTAVELIGPADSIRGLFLEACRALAGLAQ